MEGIMKRICEVLSVLGGILLGTFLGVFASLLIVGLVHNIVRIISLSTGG